MGGVLATGIEYFKKADEGDNIKASWAIKMD